MFNFFEQPIYVTVMVFMAVVCVISLAYYFMALGRCKKSDVKIVRREALNFAISTCFYILIAVLTMGCLGFVLRYFFA